jgi:hypothetical protein
MATENENINSPNVWCNDKNFQIARHYKIANDTLIYPIPTYTTSRHDRNTQISNIRLYDITQHGDHAAIAPDTSADRLKFHVPPYTM